MSDFLVELLYRLPAILIAISFHEWAHAYAAYKLGDPTARNFGRMTVNPFSHIDPLGFLSLILLRFGWAKPVPVNTRNFQNPRRDELIVSLAGVITNLFLAFIFMGVIYIIDYFVPITNLILLNMLANIYFINISLCVFNLLPIPPLDGYHVFQCLFVRNLTGYKISSFIERYSIFILVAVLLLNTRTYFLSYIVNWITYLMSAFYGLIF